MAGIANAILTSYQSTTSEATERTRGIIAVSFDQRNHGTRLIDPLANEAWRQNNPRHAPDMYTIYQGTANDALHLLNHLPSYLPRDTAPIDQHVALGVSLGAHAAWHLVTHAREFCAAVIIVGCPDYARLMAHRASKSKIAAWMGSEPKGSSFFGSEAFPDALVADVERRDPAGLLLPLSANAGSLPPLATPKPDALRPLLVRNAVQRLNKTLGGKAVLNMAGGKDKLVPYDCSKPFLDYLKGGLREWWKGGMYLEDRVFGGTKHECTDKMVREAARFIGDVVNGKIQTGKARISKI